MTREEGLGLKLRELAERMPASYETSLLHGDRDPDISSLFYDSRKTLSHPESAIFACVKGKHVDGHDLAAKALASGCAALLCEHELPFDVPQLVVKNSRAAMGEAAALLLDHPAKKMTMIAVTGTNGKTTTTYLIRSIMCAIGCKIGMLGTIVYDDGVEESDALHTTPEGPDVQEMLAKMYRNGCGACVMEASSHGLDQGRLAGCSFDRIGFSNLTPEHLEYHKDMESYFAAKHLLFADYVRGEWRASVNADDTYGRRLLDEYHNNALGFSLDCNASTDYHAKILKSDIDGMEIGIQLPDGNVFSLHSPLIGEYNASNILEALVIADSLEIDPDSIARGIAACARVPGRLERYDFTNGVSAFVDFAHSSDGMEKVLSTLRPLVKGNIWALWGAGGERTPLKRPVVGGIMSKYADRVVITTDNPRSESPAAIAAQVEEGVVSSSEKRGNMRHEVILDRREAIYYALDNADPNDVVLVAGKGPERFIDYGDRKEPFLDSAVLLEWAHARGVGVV